MHPNGGGRGWQREEPAGAWKRGICPVIHWPVPSPRKQSWIPSIPAPGHGDAVSLPRASPASCLRSFPPSKTQDLPLLVPLGLGLRGQEGTTRVLPKPRRLWAWGPGLLSSV